MVRICEPRHNILSNVHADIRKYVLWWLEHSRESNGPVPGPIAPENTSGLRHYADSVVEFEIILWLTSPKIVLKSINMTRKTISVDPPPIRILENIGSQSNHALWGVEANIMTFS